MPMPPNVNMPQHMGMPGAAPVEHHMGAHAPNGSCRDGLTACEQFDVTILYRFLVVDVTHATLAFVSAGGTH